MSMFELIVIGAGPAGMAAAAQAADDGLSVLVLDEQMRPGGQIYRDVDRAAPLRGDLLGKDYAAGLTLTKGLASPGIQYFPGASVWAIEDGWRLSYSVDGLGAMAKGRNVLLATGALERPMPLPGWTLPGVMTAGAGQILLKQSGVVAKRAVLAGSGPLLYLIAAQMVRAGTPPLALVETQTRGDFTGALRHMGGALRGWRYLLKGLGMLAEIRRAGVRRYTATRELAVLGNSHATGVRFVSGGQSHEIACDTVLLHHGVVPNTQAARAMGVRHKWSAQQQAFTPVLDDWGQSDQAGLFIAGDGTGIGGAVVAALAGRLAALKVASDLDKVAAAEVTRRAASLRRDIAREQAVRPFLDAAYPPYAGALAPKDATVVCRCEEVTAGDIRRYAKMGCLGPNQTKAFGRAGMGPCQGRYCGLSVTAILAQANGQTPEDTGYYRIRPPFKPVTLGELATLQDMGTEEAAE